MSKILWRPNDDAHFLHAKRPFRTSITDCVRVPMVEFARGVGSVSRGAVASAFFKHELEAYCKEYIEHTAPARGLSTDATAELQARVSREAGGIKHPVLAIDYMLPTVHSAYIALPEKDSWRSFLRTFAQVSSQRERVVFSYTIDIIGRICQYER